MNQIKTKRFCLVDALCAFCAAALLLGMCEAFLPYREAKIYNGLIRLHIIANSDSKTDQNVKLAVRDELLSLSGTYFSSCKNLKEANNAVNEMKDALVLAADRVIAENGLNYQSHAVIGKEAYDTREYDGISFPKGEYLSFRIVLGDGNGKNWWCVLFPPLCLSAASAAKGLSDVGINKEEQKTFTSSNRQYRFKFKFLEWFFT